MPEIEQGNRAHSRNWPPKRSNGTSRMYAKTARGDTREEAVQNASTLGLKLIETMQRH